MLCTLVFAIGTFPYALRTVAIPWSLDQDRSWASCFGEVLWSCAKCFRLGDGNFLSLTFFLVFFSADEEKKHVYALECFVDVWFFSLLRFGASSMCNFLSSLDISAQLFVTLDVCAIDVFDNINIYRHYCKESTCNSRNMPDDNELRAFFAMSEAILNTEEIRFQWSKRTLLRQKNMDAYWRYSVIVNFISGGTWIVCSSSLRAPMMFLFRWAKWTAVSQLITPVQAFQFDNSSFLYASFSTLNWAQCCTTFLLKKWLSTGQRQTEVPFA